jgi:peptide/nickel transport system substrate-binding protein
MCEGTLTRQGFIRQTAVVSAGALGGALGLLVPAAPVAAQAPRQVPRSRTLILMGGGGGGQFQDTGIGNPYAVGYTHQMGNNTISEPLYYYSAFADEMIPWLADGEPVWNEDYTQVWIRVRRGAQWSDGMPFTARDVVFTLQMLLAHAPALPYSADVREYVKETIADDDETVHLIFHRPNPRFVFDYLTFKFDTGLKIVPAHIFQDVDDPASFSFYDPERGWPVGTGPYRITYWDTTQKFMDRRDDWWAVAAGLSGLPKVERLIFLPWSDDTRVAQLVITDQIDTSFPLLTPTIRSVLQQNKRVITHSFDKPPYGYVDWWPTSLWFNCAEPPFNDAELRWAISYAINREQLVQVGQEGAGQVTALPYPDFPPLRPFIAYVQDLVQQYPTTKFDPAATERIMRGKGYTKDRDGLWVKEGKRIEMAIHGYPHFADIGPLLAEMLRRAGFDASYTMPADWITRIALGEAKTFLFGHGASIADPYFTLTLYHGRYWVPIGQPASGGRFSRWRNAEFDRIVDEMATVPREDPRLLDLFHAAMAIWLRELPECPLVQFYHRIPMNQTYWTGWPTVLNPYVNGAFWHLTFPLILRRLQPVQ